MIKMYRIRKNVPGIGRNLARALGADEVTSQKQHTAIGKDDWIINYGRTVEPEWEAQTNPMQWFNKPYGVSVVCDKLKTFGILGAYNISHVPYTTTKETAQLWLDKGSTVYIRHTLRGRKGQGIQILTDNSQILPDAPLYTKGVNNRTEYRVHMFDCKIIDITQKKKMGSKKREARNIGEVNTLVRNRSTGWVYAHKDIEVPDIVKEVAYKTSVLMFPDIRFMGIDVFYTPKEDKAVVCELNSAPGMYKVKTFNAYVDAFKEAIQ